MKRNKNSAKDECCAAKLPKILPEDVTHDEKFMMEEILSTRHVANELYSRKNPRCWGCEFGFAKPMFPGKNPTIDLLWKVYEDHADESPWERAKWLSEAHEKLVLLPALKTGDKTVYEWSRDQVLLHLTRCLTIRELDLVQTIKDYQTIEHQLFNTAFEKKGETMEGRPKVIELLIKVTKQKESLWESYI